MSVTEQVLFSDIISHPGVLEAIGFMGFASTTPVQAKAIPLILAGHDAIICAQTGTGKTAAYLLPILQKLVSQKAHRTRVLVVVPTRELAMQIEQQLQGFSYSLDISSIAIYGGNDSARWDDQKQSLQHNVDIIVATPGRLMMHLNFAYTDLGGVEYLILDEADRMLDMGFHEDIVSIIKHLPAKRQNLMFSATMPPQMRKLAKAIMNEPHEINLQLAKPAEGILQGAYILYNPQKIQVAKSLLLGKEIQSTIIFVSTKKMADQLNRELQQHKMDSRAIHSDLEQKEREQIMLDFKNHRFPILVATNILSRGIDIDNIELIINYDVPQDADEYVHRVGRTARANKQGVAITFVSPDEQSQFQRIEELIETVIFKVPLPADMGEAPEYAPQKQRTHGHRGKAPFRNNRNTPKRRPSK